MADAWLTCIDLLNGLSASTIHLRLLKTLTLCLTITRWPIIPSEQAQKQETTGQ
jgi:hypothetical protein